MVVHSFELVNGEWSYSGKECVCTHNIREELEHNEALEGLEVHATVNDKTLTMMYNDAHLDSDRAKREIQHRTAKLAHLFVIKHANVKRKGANLIRFRYTFERTI